MKRSKMTLEDAIEFIDHDLPDGARDAMLSEMTGIPIEEIPVRLAELESENDDE